MSTIKVNTLDTTSGTEITVASGKTLSVGGKSVTAGSSNIQRATGDVTVATTATVSYTHLTLPTNREV